MMRLVAAVLLAEDAIVVVVLAADHVDLAGMALVAARVTDVHRAKRIAARSVLRLRAWCAPRPLRFEIPFVNSSCAHR